MAPNIDEQVHFAQVSEGSAMDYFAAAVGATGEASAALLLLAHTQAVSSLTMWASVLQSDPSRKADYDRASDFENDLRYEVLLWMRECDPAGVFPQTEILRGLANSLEESFGPDFPRAFLVDLQTSWERPFSNVYHGPPPE